MSDLNVLVREATAGNIRSLTMRSLWRGAGSKQCRNLVGELIFYRATLCQRGLCCGPVSVLQVGVLLKWLDIGSRKQCHTIAQGLQFSGAKDLCKIPPGSPPAGHQMQVGWVKIGDYRQIAGYMLKTVQDRRIVSIKVEQEVIRALSNGGIAHDLDCPLNTPNHPIFCILHSHSQLRNG